MDDAQPQNPVQELQQPIVPNTPKEQLKPQILSKTPIIIMIIVTVISLALSGYLAYQNYNLNQQIGQSEEISPSPTADPTADWKTYKSDRYKYEFKYPEEIFKGELYVYDDGKTVNITNEVSKKLLELDKNSGFQLSIGIRDDRSELGDYNSYWQKDYSDLGLLKTGQEINNIKRIDELEIIGKVSGIFLNEQQTDPQIYKIFTFLENDGSLYEISLNSFNKDLLETKIYLFENIINTFKILNPVDDWNIYNSSQLNYSFKYPTTYTVYSPTPDGKYEGNLNIVSNSDQINLSLADTAGKQTGISFEDKVKNFQYWDWKNKKSKMLTINGQKAYWMTGEENGKKQELWLIEGKNHYFEFRTILDYDSTIINSIINSFTSF